MTVSTFRSHAQHVSLLRARWRPVPRCQPAAAPRLHKSSWKTCRWQHVGVHTSLTTPITPTHCRACCPGCRPLRPTQSHAARPRVPALGPQVDSIGPDCRKGSPRGGFLCSPLGFRHGCGLETHRVLSLLSHTSLSPPPPLPLTKEPKACSKGLTLWDPKSYSVTQTAERVGLHHFKVPRAVRWENGLHPRVLCYQMRSPLTTKAWFWLSCGHSAAFRKKG